MSQISPIRALLNMETASYGANIISKSLILACELRKAIPYGLSLKKRCLVLGFFWTTLEERQDTYTTLDALL